GLANSSGKVGKYLMFNGQAYAYGLFEHPLNEYKSVQVTRVVHDFYDADPARGFYGGGAIDARFSFGPAMFALFGMPLDAPQWGPEFKRNLREYFTRTVEINAHTTSLPLESNSISLDPDVKDRWGRPAIRVTYRDHPDDLATMRFLQEQQLRHLGPRAADHDDPGAGVPGSGAHRGVRGERRDLSRRHGPPEATLDRTESALRVADSHGRALRIDGHGDRPEPAPPPTLSRTRCSRTTGTSCSPPCRPARRRIRGRRP